MSFLYQTPEFLAWTLALDCPLRAGGDVCSPEQTERHLRAARAAGEGIVEGRVHGGVCVGRNDSSLGFRVDDALAVYGGLAVAEMACGLCRANAAMALGTSTLAGCYGELPRADEGRLDWAAIVDEAIRRLDLAQTVGSVFPRASQFWYALWISRPLTPEQLEILERLWRESLRIEGRNLPAAILFGEAISRAKQTAIPLFVELHPPGDVDTEGNWHVPATCPHCRFVWNERSASCLMCGWTGHHIGPRRRKLRGRRPYRELREFLTPAEIEAVRAAADCEETPE